jgi:4-amino-4-deoxy-L-arabinose transferase-like glycosyltransferase
VSRKTKRPKPAKPRAITPDQPVAASPAGPAKASGPSIPLPTVATSDSARPKVARAQFATNLGVLALLCLHYFMAAQSLVQENPTVDEVVHLPAGVTYWQKGTFRLYPHNPPLVKLVAALPVVWSGVVTAPLYATPAWTSRFPSQTNFSQYFAFLNYNRYFELCQLARLTMPLFSVVGGLVVFAWSRRLYGVCGGFLSLALWVFCPNVLAHGRLITSDAGAAAMGVLATYLFWRYLDQPGWRWAVAAGVGLGLAQLTKFSLLVLLAVWPFLWLLRLVLVEPRSKWLSRIPTGLGHGLTIALVCVLTIDAGYLFEGVGMRLGQFEFASRSLTQPVRPGMDRPRSPNGLLDLAWTFRINRFRETWLAGVPCPLPEHYILGFDEQKLEAEGIPRPLADAYKSGNVAPLQGKPEPPNDRSEGYTVYLNGEVRRNGWWYYYALALAYKVPEGTWLLVLFAMGVSLKTLRSRTAIADEISLWTVPLIILGSMSFLTDINLGLRYVLPIAPYVFIAVGKVAPFALGLTGMRRSLMAVLAGGSLAATIAASVVISPSYLAYFNWVSGGPDRVPARLIDSNLDWGQDLVGLQKWWSETIPDQPIGLAYFGQISPSLFAMRGQPFRWFLAPAPPGTIRPLNLVEDPFNRQHKIIDPALVGPAHRLEPGYYAVSATLLYGVPFRLYDPAPLSKVPQAMSPAWNTEVPGAFSYFKQFEPITRIGHSIYVYRLSPEQAARVRF